jgi:ribosome maturation factor RimP
MPGQDDVLEQVEKIVAEKGLLLVDANLFQAGRRQILRILVDRPGRITLDECAAVSRAVGDAVETLGLIENTYTLEVSSPGIGRPLTTANDWLRSVGRKLHIAAEDGEYTGILQEVRDGSAFMEDGTEIGLETVTAAREVL